MESLTQFIRTTHYPAASDVQRLGAGMFSQAYRFDVAQEAFVVRIGITREAFDKDRLAYQWLNQTTSVPRVLAIGDYLADQFYCISEWKVGGKLTDLTKTETERLLPSIFDNLLLISQVSVLPTVNFGILNHQGGNRKAYASWADFVCAADDFPQIFTPRGDEQYQPWHQLYTTTFLDPNVVREANQRLTYLRPFLPNERHLVHGDFGHDNALAQSDQLTALLDWAELRCGDWLYDLAYLAYYDPFGIDYETHFRRWANGHGLSLPNFSERMEACFLAIFLGNIFLEANRAQRDWYEEDIARFRDRFSR